MNTRPHCLRASALLAAALALKNSVACAQAPDDPRYAALSPITFHSDNTTETLTLRPYLADGTLDPSALRQLSHLLRDPRNDEDSPLVARTVRLLIRVSEHFHATRINVVSGYRSRRYRREGYHGEGSAIDFRLPGASMLEVAAYARTLSHVGVGWYPRSGFVHLDSRGSSYFWINRAGGRSHGSDHPLDRGATPSRDRAWSPADDLPWDPPDAHASLDLHPRVLHDRPRHRSRHRNRHTRRQHRPSLNVFQGQP